VLQTIEQDPDATLAASFSYLMLVGYVCGGWQMARAAVAARACLQSGEHKGFYRAKIATATFYAEQIMPKANALLSVREERRLDRLGPRRRVLLRRSGPRSATDRVQKCNAKRWTSMC